MALPGVTALLWNVADSTETIGGATDALGAFALQVRRTGRYRLRLSFVGFQPYQEDIVVDSAYSSVGTIRLKPGVVDMDEVLVEGVQERICISGDTTIYNADAFKVNPDASAQDLVEKMPRVVVRDGQVEAEGEQVQRVTVDSREFFGNDPTAALRNMPADLIQSIEVFDRESDQAQFTGFNDGNTQKTINIVTRTGRNNGQFGKAYGGYCDETRYIAGGNANFFDGDRRIFSGRAPPSLRRSSFSALPVLSSVSTQGHTTLSTVVALRTLIGAQNFASEDLLGLGGGNARSGPRGGGDVRGGRGNTSRGLRGGGRSGFNPRNFLVGQQGGLNTTSSVGVNYSDQIGSRMRASGSYFSIAWPIPTTPCWTESSSWPASSPSYIANQPNRPARTTITG